MIYYSVDGGSTIVSLSSVDLPGDLGANVPAGVSDCAISNDGTTIIVAFGSITPSGSYSYSNYLAISTNSGSSWTPLYPPTLLANATPLKTACVSTDGLCIIVGYQTGVQYLADISFDQGTTWASSTADPSAQVGDSLVASYVMPSGGPSPITLEMGPGSYLITGYPADLVEGSQPLPVETEIHRKIRDPWDCDEWGRFQPGACIRPIY
jgi:hypothetical protein